MPHHSGNTTSPIESARDPGAPDDREPPLVPALTLAWALEEPHRAGEIAFFPGTGRSYLGRPDPDDDLDQVPLVRLRPGLIERAGSLGGKHLSRRQLCIDVSGDEVEIQNVGRLRMHVNGVETKRAALSPGDVVVLRQHSGFVFSMRPAALPKLAADYPAFRFGEPDAFGIVGESPAIWELREQLAVVARFDEHVLLLGESGSGKELAARAIHLLSRRARGPFVDRNAATLTSELAGPEIYGNPKDWPNPGMPESEGLLGAARGGTLFLDEIGEIPPAVQAKLLRVFDPDARYQRLGDPKPRKADVRFVCATNRAPGELKHDFAARFQHRIELPPLDARREDIPLIARALVLEAARRSPAAAERFVRTGGPRPEANLDAALVAHLVRREYPTNVRDLGRVLREAMAASRDDTLRVFPEMEAAPPQPRAPASPPPSEGAVRAALAQNGGNVTRAAGSMHISRFALMRLMDKYAVRAVH